jgi:hypothetical protein
VRPSTRIIIVYSHLWEPVLKIAEALGLRASSPGSTTSRPPISAISWISPIAR